MFKEINDFKLKICNEKSSYYIPNVISMGPLEDLFEATEWLVKEAVGDYEKTHQRIRESRKKEGFSRKNIEEDAKLRIRTGSRTLGYINQLCLMEDILVHEYDRMLELVKEASGGKINCGQKQDYKSFKARFAPIRTFRCKVAVHTAYTYPKINKKTGEVEDNPETIVRSILNLFPKFGGSLRLGNNFYCGFPKYVPQFSIVSPVDWKRGVMPIFEDWKKLFIDKLKSIHKVCPFKNKFFSINIACRRLVVKDKKKV